MVLAMPITSRLRNKREKMGVLGVKMRISRRFRGKFGKKRGKFEKKQGKNLKNVKKCQI
jgi:hypothetical protein